MDRSWERRTATLAAAWARAWAHRDVVGDVVGLSYSHAGRALLHPLLTASASRVQGPVVLAQANASDLGVFPPRLRSSIPPVEAHWVRDYGVLAACSQEEGRVGHSVLWWCTGRGSGLLEMSHAGVRVELDSELLGAAQVLETPGAAVRDQASAWEAFTDAFDSLGLQPPPAPPVPAQPVLVAAERVTGIEQEAAERTLMPMVVVQDGLRGLVAFPEAALVVDLLRRWLAPDQVECYLGLLRDEPGLSPYSAMVMARTL